jgi:CcmD family protein
MNLNSLLFILAQTTSTPPPTADQVDSGFVYVIAAFIAVWLLIAGYLFWLHRRQESLRQEVEQLRQEEAERQSVQAPAPTAPYTGLDPKLEVSGTTQAPQSNLRG